MTTPRSTTDQPQVSDVEARKAVAEIRDTVWYDFDRVHFADSVTGLTVGDLRGLLDSIPAQIEAAVAEATGKFSSDPSKIMMTMAETQAAIQAEREACAVLLERRQHDPARPVASGGYELVLAVAAIRSRGVAK